MVSTSLDAWMMKDLLEDHRDIALAIARELVQALARVNGLQSRDIFVNGIPVVLREDAERTAGVKEGKCLVLNIV